MKIFHIGRLTALALTLATGVAQASTVSILNWTFGSGKKVNATGYSDYAGGMTVNIGNAGSDSASGLTTYAIEIGKDLPSSSGSSNYTVQDGSSYFQTQFNDASIATRLGRLMTVVGATPSLVDTAAESASLQLAVWNLIYDNDYSVSSGSFRDSSSYASNANSLLSLAQAETSNGYTLKVLKSSEREDLFYTVASSSGSSLMTSVPEPATLGLVAFGLLGVGVVAGRKRRRG